jgi:hypothetical protein
MTESDKNTPDDSSLPADVMAVVREIQKKVDEARATRDPKELERRVQLWLAREAAEVGR